MKRTLGWLTAGALCLAAAVSPAQPAHIYGIHDESPWPGDWLSRCPGGVGWITATEAIGTNPNDFGGKAYNPGSNKLLVRLNNGYHPNGTIPAQSQYTNFAQRVKNFVAASSGADTWIIGNETNLSVEWPGGNQYISPAMYADCFVKCYNAIKSIPGKGSSQKVIVQALAPWAGPYTGQPDNWVDYSHKMLAEIQALGVTPDGLALHINSRGYGPLATDVTAATRGEAGGLTLDFGWLVHRDWIQFGIPRNMWNLPLYATECNGLNYWKGGGPEQGLQYPSYTSGWLQAVYTSVNDWNQNAKNYGMPIYRAVNMYRWESDDWAINSSPNKGTILNDLSSAAASNYTWPNYGGNKLNIGTPSGTRISSGITATASSESSTTYNAAKAVDGSNTTYWASNDTGLSGVHWLVLDLGSSKSVTGYIVRHASAAGLSVDQNTRGFYIETSTSASGPWATNTMVRTSNPGVNPPASTSLYYDTARSIRYIRLLVNDAANTTSNVRARIPEFEVYQAGGGTPTPTPTPSPTATPSPTPSPSLTATPSPTPGITINVFQQLATSVSGLANQPSSSDNLNGKVATRISGGFHSANSNSAGWEPAFTDGAGVSGLNGLLADYPGQNSPAWRGFWNLNNGGQVNLTELRFFSANGDGRAFHHYDVYTTTASTPAAGSTWTLLKSEVIPAAFGTAIGSNAAALTKLTRSGGGSMASGITGIRIDMYAVHNLDNILHDDWNARVGDDRDNTAAAYVSPIVIEVDAYYTAAGTPTPSPTATPTPTPSPTPSGNLVTNGSFENGFTGGVGNGWTSWSSGWSNPITFGQASANKYDGSYSQYWARTADNLRLHGGVYQRITGLSNGQQYRIQAALKRQCTATDVWLEFGYDLTGGTAAEASSVTYTKLEGAGNNVWATYDQTVTATGSAITLFAKGGHYQENGAGNAYFYVDAVSMVTVP